MPEARQKPTRPWAVRGRGADHNPPNRFESIHLEILEDEDVPAGPRTVSTHIQNDCTVSILTPNQSPDIPFNWSLNPYRGCEHGCVYCYARPGHEALGHGCGLDFETQLVAKPDAPKLLRKALGRPNWAGQTIALGSCTDAYQPIESKLAITQKCLDVLADFFQPTLIITKSRLVLRDLKPLKILAEKRAVRVAISLTTLDNTLASKMEPRASSPRDRLWTIRRLASAGIDVTAMVAPIIPAINDREIPKILEAASAAGARSASMVMLRLPHQLKALFERWLEVHFPDRRKHVLNLLQQIHGGQAYDPTFGKRMHGQGVYARQIRQTFELFARRNGLMAGLPPLNRHAFRRPAEAAQMHLFDANV